MINIYSIPNEVLFDILSRTIDNYTPIARRSLIYVCKLWYTIISNHIQMFIDIVAKLPDSSHYNYLPAMAFAHLSFEQKIMLANETEIHSTDGRCLAQFDVRYMLSWQCIFEYLSSGKINIFDDDTSSFPVNTAYYFMNVMANCEQFRRDIFTHVPNDILDRMIVQTISTCKHGKCSYTDFYRAIWLYLNACHPSVVIQRTYEEHDQLRSLYAKLHSKSI